MEKAGNTCNCLAAQETERLRENLKLLADELVYHGNSVSHWYAKGTAYKAAIGKVCDVATKHGVILDGRTDVSELLDAHLGQLRARIAELEKDRPSLKELLAQITPENRHELLWDGEKDRPEVVQLVKLMDELQIGAHEGEIYILHAILKKYPNGIKIVQDKGRVGDGM